MVFGGIERILGKCFFLIEVPDQWAEILKETIVRYFQPGSHIVSDDWAAYAGIEKINYGIDFHNVVIHQNVENLWMCVKCVDSLELPRRYVATLRVRVALVVQEQSNIFVYLLRNPSLGIVIMFNCNKRRYIGLIDLT